jgi:putative acyl-CoA dehydrogenase
MRRGVLEAIHHARHREAFGGLLVDQPAMANVLADLAIDSEAATVAALRVARSYDSLQEGPFRRVATAVMKYWVCKRAPAHAGEALECLGGNGYVEDSGMPLLYRDAPLNSIWEGSGNVSALDVLRAVISEPAGLPALLAECGLGMGGDARLDRHVKAVREKAASVLDNPQDAQFQARHLVEDLALALQGSLLVRNSPPAVADAFCAARLDRQGGLVYGTLPRGVDARGIVDRSLPA